MPIPTRLSGLAAARPTAASAVGARFFATDTLAVTFSTGSEWVASDIVELDQIVNTISGTLAARPTAGACVGCLYIDESGLRYAAFPGGWATMAAPDGTPSFASLSGAVADNAALVAALATKEAAQTAASQAEAEAGVETAIRKFSPLRIAQAIAALGGGGGASTPKVAYVETTGNNATGAIGNPALPYLTAQAAYNAIVASAVNCCLHVGVGTFAGIAVTGGNISAYLTSIVGCGASVSFLGGISSTGTAGNPGTNAGTITITSDRSVDLGDVTSAGGDGYPGTGNGEVGKNAGIGGDIVLFDCVGSVVESVGGSGGTGGTGYANEPVGDLGGTGGDGGAAGVVSLTGCHFTTATSVGGAGGLGGEGGPGETGGSSGANGADGAPSTLTLLQSKATNVTGEPVVLGCSVYQAITGTLTDLGGNGLIV